MCIRDRYQRRVHGDIKQAMKYLFAALLIFTVYGADFANITCWDTCQGRCEARYGQLTDQCVKSCRCPCNTQCDDICTKYGLGLACKFKCGCFQNHTFTGLQDEEELIPPNEVIDVKYQQYVPPPQGAAIPPQPAPVPPKACLLYTSPSPRDATLSRMPSSA
eukprot:TRINITY_DN1699_c0_g1_i2.p2 TRINITY_DN1699_c0_g1~~TRINITY_DN1699_c0_g1_i2.p2  ORF type:complete len:182 (+),score=39.93 TRINITY_DN1699_c0_g1_i2:62-547(+)